MIYRELIQHLEELEEEQLNHTVMCSIDDEYYKVLDYTIKENDGRIEDGHPYLIVE